MATSIASPFGVRWLFRRGSRLSGGCASGRHPDRIAPLIRTGRLRGFSIAAKKVSTLKPIAPPRRINTCEWLRPRSAMSDTLSAALIGAIAGYIIARHCPELDWILRILTG